VPRPPPVPPQPVLSQGDYSYTVNADGHATIVGFNKDFKGDLTILDTLGGCPVSSIARNAFSSATGITRVAVPASVTSFADASGAFASCAQLTAIDVDPANITYSSIGGVLFNKDQTSLLFVPAAIAGTCAIPRAVTTIEPDVFPERKGLTAFAVDEANPAYSSRDGVLFNKEQTTLIQCPVGKSGNYAIPAGVSDIRDRAFLRCAGLTEITIPASVTRIGNSAFYQCDALTAIHVDESNKTYSSLDGVLLGKDQTALVLCPAARKGDYAIPAKITRLDRSGFTACASLTSVKVPEGITHIDNTAFWGCRELKAIHVDAANKSFSSLNGVLFNKEQTILIRCPRGLTGEHVIPTGVSAIGAYAFYGCTGLTHVTIPESITSIAYQAFLHCDKLAATIQGIGRISFNAPTYPAPGEPPGPRDPATATSPGSAAALPAAVPGPAQPSGSRPPRMRVIPPR
jgi:hypothetical protein